MKENKFVITTDMTADLPDGYLEERGIDVVSMPYTLDGVEYERWNTLSFPEFYAKLREGAMPTTSQISAFDATRIFEKHLKDGEDILHICFSSGMSGSYETLLNIANGLCKQYPERKIRVVDSLSGSGGEGLMVYYADKMKQSGKTLDDIFVALEESRLRYHHFFIVEDLGFLCRGGRLSKLEARVGTVLGIKPLLELNMAGKIMPLLKVMGKRKAMNAMVEQVVKHIVPSKNDFILVEHGDDINSARAFADKIKEAIPGARIEFQYVDYLVGSHAGAGSLAVFFVGETRPRFINLPIGSKD